MTHNRTFAHAVQRKFRVWRTDEIMAQTKKPASGAKRSTSSKKKKAASSRARTQKPTGLRREAWGILVMLVGILVMLALLNADGVLTRWLNRLLRGLIGPGFYILPFVLFVMALLLLMRPKEPLKLRMTALFALPLLYGAVYHVFSDPNGYAFTLDGLKALYMTGTAGVSGGLIAGGFGIVLRYMLSKAGAAILLIAAIAGAVLAAFHLTIPGIVGAVRALLPEPVEAEDEPEPERKKVKTSEVASLSATRSRIDIPIEDEATEKERPRRERGKAFTFRPPSVKTPAQVLAEKEGGVVTPSSQVAMAQMQEVAPPAAVPAPEPIAVREVKPEPISVAPGAVQPAAPREEPHTAPKPAAPQSGVPDFSKLYTPPAEEKQPEPQAADDAPFDLDEEKSAAPVPAQVSATQAGTPPPYQYPPLTLLKQPAASGHDFTQELQVNATRLTDTLSSFGIEAKIINITHGPSVTRYEMQISRGIKFSRVTGLSDDIALSLGAASVRIAPIPDKVAIGIEVPNQTVETVCIREVLSSRAFETSASRLAFAVGKDITGACVAGDIAKMPHMLIAGTTGSGKSVCINSLLISLLYKSTPEEVRLIMIDPKMIELGIYNGIPHLLIPVVTDPKKAAGALNWAVMEMMKRYKLFAEQNVRDLASYNEAVKKSGEAQPLPQVVIVIDELADLMFVAANEVEEAICRIAQMARAAGMHLVIATQRPSADVITGIMKANIPSRIAFAVASQIESRIILDTMGAEKLIGRGDMLYYPLGSPKPMRVQGCFITSAEVESVVEFIKTTGTPDYSNEVLEHIEKAATETGSKGGSSAAGGSDDDDELMPAAIEIVVETGQASVSMLQRRLKLGYSRAARLVDQMEERGIVGPFEGSKPRQVLITKSEWAEMELRRKEC